MTEDEKTILEHEMEEWKYLNAYVNQMDLGYQRVIVIAISVLSVLAALASSGNILGRLKFLFFMVPIGIVACFAYLSYQFRIVAILRGHLEALEIDMNKRIGKDVHLWNSALVEVFMAHNNLINQNMLIPILAFILLLTAYCAYFSYAILKPIEHGEIILLVYWLVVGVLSMIVLIPFLQNDKVRKETFNEERIIKKYKYYCKMWKENNKDKIYRYDTVKLKMSKTEILKKSFLFGFLNFILGFGMLWVLSVLCKYNRDLPGLFDYYAATIGDGVFLSILIGAGVYYIETARNSQTNKNKYLKLSNAVSLFGCIIGIFWQISWLLKDDIELNWTIPSIGKMNLAGVYHAVYFVAMFVIIPRIFVNVIMYNRALIEQSGLSYTLMWIALMGYWATHLMDDCLTEENYIIWITISSLCFIVLYLLLTKRIETKYLIFTILYTFFQQVVLLYFCSVGGLNWNVTDLVKRILNLQ